MTGNQGLSSFRAWAIGFLLAIAVLAVLALQSGYTVGKDIALRDNARDSRPWAAEKAAAARADCSRRHSGLESEAARKACPARIPFDGDWLTYSAPDPDPGPTAAAAARSPAPE